MTETIQTIAADLTRRVGEWASQPDEATAGLTELRERLDALRGAIGGGAASEALKALSGSEKAIQDSRKKEAATVIAASLRELGIRLDPGAPLKRVRRAPAKPAPKASTPDPAPIAAEQPPEHERETVFGRRRAQ